MNIGSINLSVESEPFDGRHEDSGDAKRGHCNVPGNRSPGRGVFVQGSYVRER